MGYKYVVIIRDPHGRTIESVGTNNKYYAKWVCDVETREQGHNCEVIVNDDFEESDLVL